MAPATVSTAEQLRSFLRSTPSSVSTPLALQQALQAVQDLAVASNSNAYVPPVSIPDFDQDPFSSLLRPSLQTTSPVASTSNSASTGAALAWLHRALPDEYKANQVLEILQSERDDADIQESLLNVWGFEGIEDMGEAVRRRTEIVHEAAGHKVEPSNATQAPDAPSASSLSAHARDYTPGAQLQFATQEEVQAMKLARKMIKKERGKARAEGDSYDEPDVEEWLRRREEDLARGPGDLVSGKRPAIEEAVEYPNVYLASKTTGLNIGASKMSLPIGTTRLHKEHYEEITIPAPKAVPFRFNESLVPIKDMNPWGKRTFHAYKTLNRLQSIVYPVAYGSNENMLVCAPTGAGKTDVALLTILRCLSSLVSTPLTSMSETPKLPPASQYKIIYVAPLKALAAEITQKFAKRLAWAGVKCRELTGDMKMTKKEIDETGVIVTTPEKWDVVTRKGAGSGEGEVAEKVKLLIIDEVHLLHEDRGAVIESIVARTQRQVESSQSLIRVVGLSATLPNYVDVADFLGVNRYTGLFFFDSSFRPVPLEQHFVGVKGKPGSPASRTNLDNAAFDKVAELVKAGHQCMVFVHARKDTVKTAQMLREKAQAEGILDLLDPSASETNDQWTGFKRDLATSRNREMKDLAASGFGIHHAGMLRSDRNIAERMFENNVTKVLCCTATLAWGVNLPAYAVVIKGTQVYDAGKGAFVDLSILDVLQIFGRAGRPQYEDQGVGYICTTSDKLDHYVSAISQQHPIESKFVAGLVDSLNAEISLGTVTNMDEGVRWLGYSYLFVRMRKNPLVYGMTADEVIEDPLLGSKRHALINNSAKRLVECDMIKFDPDLGTLACTDLGRIASRYYIRNDSIEIFNKLFRPAMSEADILGLIASSVEFAQIQVRENEVEELKTMMESDSCPCQVRGGTDSSAGKVNILLQAYISRTHVEDFALISDMGYVSQNAARIVRALLDIALARRWAPVSVKLLSMSKSIEKRMWSFVHPLSQFGLPADLVFNIEKWADDLPIYDIAAMSDAEFGATIRQNERLGGFATRAARQLPSVEISTSLQPLAHDLLGVRIELRKAFEWAEKHHGTAEAFWVWVEDEQNLSILQLARILVRPHSTVIRISFTIPVTTAPKALFVRAISDRWIGAEEEYIVDLDGLILPPPPPPHLPLLDLPLLSASDSFAQHPQLRDLYGNESSTFDPVQTQAFHSVFHTASNVLLCTPSATSRGTLLEIAIWRTFNANPTATILFLTPRKALARQVALRQRHVFTRTANIPVLTVTRQDDLTDAAAAGPRILVTSPSTLLRKFIGQPDLLGQIDLILAHDLHALDANYELLVSRLRWQYPTTRIVGSSSSLADARAISTWLDVPEHASYSFSPSVRTSALSTAFQSFSTPHSFALLRAMVKPAYDAMRTASGSTLAFVPSRSQCRVTAKDLVTHSASDLEESFVAEGSLETVEAYSRTLSDPDLREALTHGIAVFHEGLRPEEQRIALELFGSGMIRVLIASREACWTLPVRASLVVVMSAQYASLRPTTAEPERVIQDYPMSELLQMQSLAVPASPDASANMLVLCQKDQSDLYSKYLQQGVSLESELPFNSLLPSTVLTDLFAGRVNTKQDILDLVSWSFLARRLEYNPSYYALSHEPSTAATGGRPSLDAQLSRLTDSIVSILESRCCVVVNNRNDFEPSKLGKWFHSKVGGGEAVDEIERLQSIELDDLFRAAVPKRKKKPEVVLPAKQQQQDPDDQGPTPSENLKQEQALSSKKAKKSKEPETPLSSFLQRLPRLVKTDIGDRPDDFEDEDWQTRVLLAAFRAGRIPRDETLETKQVLVLEKIAQSRI
ncbi:uncharacterized protein JCM15063_005710 [Sporobolomyces koalae]|uniref:uncharacterized protein n=1 Tax=Sporobolomyces koalae TaxID=500713 RepID=UPI00316CD19E